MNYWIPTPVEYEFDEIFPFCYDEVLEVQKLFLFHWMFQYLKNL